MSQPYHNNHPPPPGGDSRHTNGGGEFYHQGHSPAVGGGRRRPHPASFADNNERNMNNFHNEYDPNCAADNGERSGNNWGPSNNFRGGGRGGGYQRGGGGRPFQQHQHSDPHYNNNQRDQQQHQHHQSQRRKSDTQQNPLPPDQRRTLVLANVPPHIKHFHIKSHFSQNWGIPVEYALVDKQSGLAYVRFESVDDAKRVWAVGTNGLDGPNYQSGGGEHNQQSSSLMAEGVVLQEVHPTNYVSNDNKKYGDDTQASPAMSRKHGRCADEYSGRGDREGYSNHYPDERDSKIARRHSGQNFSATQQHGSDMKPPPSSTTSINPSNNSYNRKDKEQKQQHQLTPEQLEAKKQKQEEYQKQFEAFQKEEQEWRKRRNAEYQTFATAKKERTSQISTLQQKKELQAKQESMLAKQLPLHKKMLSMLKSKNAPASEQSKKMKEILSAQTQLLQLKKDMKQNVEELEKLKEEERIKGVFVPSEKRPVFVSNGDSAGVKKRSLDRRSTVLRVEGFECEEVNDEVIKAELKEHFSAFGAVSDVTLEKANGDDGSNDAASVFALVHFSTRLDAEKAKGCTNFKEVSLKCTWYHESSSASPGDGDDTGGGEGNSVCGDGEESNPHDELYGNDEVEESYAEYFAEGVPPGEVYDDMVDYDYGGDEDMVDYD